MRPPPLWAADNTAFPIFFYHCIQCFNNHSSTLCRVKRRSSREGGVLFRHGSSEVVQLIQYWYSVKCTREQNYAIILCAGKGAVDNVMGSYTLYPQHDHICNTLHCPFVQFTGMDKFNGHLPVVKLLLGRGAERESKDNLGCMVTTPSGLSVIIS